MPKKNVFLRVGQLLSASTALLCAAGVIPSGAPSVCLFICAAALITAGGGFRI